MKRHEKAKLLRHIEYEDIQRLFLYPIETFDEYFLDKRRHNLTIPDILRNNYVQYIPKGAWPYVRNDMVRALEGNTPGWDQLRIYLSLSEIISDQRMRMVPGYSMELVNPISSDEFMDQYNEIMNHLNWPQWARSKEILKEFGYNLADTEDLVFDLGFTPKGSLEKNFHLGRAVQAVYVVCRGQAHMQTFIDKTANYRKDDIVRLLATAKEEGLDVRRSIKMFVDICQYLTDGLRISQVLLSYKLPNDRNDDEVNPKRYTPNMSPREMIQASGFNHRLDRRLRAIQTQQRAERYLSSYTATFTIDDDPLPEDLEKERLKTGADLVYSGNECKHCIGSYATDTDNVYFGRVRQCFDMNDRITDNSKAYANELERRLYRKVEMIRPGRQAGREESIYHDAVAM